MAQANAVDAELLALVGQTIDERYRIDEVLGSGGMGAVFRAHHLGLGQDVAIKVLHPDLLGRSSAKRFRREAQAASRLDHPNIVRVTDFGELPNGGNYLVMQLLEGQELASMLGAPWAPERAVRVIMQVCSALEHAHHNGIVHRDLKPANIFITSDHRGRPSAKLLDFGIAKVMSGEGANDGLTRTGMIFGTPRYMSPEQASGDTIDERTDIYAVGIMLYELLAGRPPFQGSSSSMVMRLQLTAPPPMLPETVPSGLSALVREMLEKSREERPPTVSEVLERLEGLLPGLEGIPAAPLDASTLVSGASQSGLDATAPPTAGSTGGGATAMTGALTSAGVTAPPGSPLAAASTAELSTAAPMHAAAISTAHLRTSSPGAGPSSSSPSIPALGPPDHTPAPAPALLYPPDTGGIGEDSSPDAFEARRRQRRRRRGLVLAVAMLLVGGGVFTLGFLGVIPGLPGIGTAAEEQGPVVGLPPPEEGDADTEAHSDTDASTTPLLGVEDEPSAATEDAGDAPAPPAADASGPAGPSPSSPAADPRPSPSPSPPPPSPTPSPSPSPSPTPKKSKPASQADEQAPAGPGVEPGTPTSPGDPSGPAPAPAPAPATPSDDAAGPASDEPDAGPAPAPEPAPEPGKPAEPGEPKKSKKPKRGKKKK